MPALQYDRHLKALASLLKDAPSVTLRNTLANIVRRLIEHDVTTQWVLAEVN
jgi:hypothetical protein